MGSFLFISDYFSHFNVFYNCIDYQITILCKDKQNTLHAIRLYQIMCVLLHLHTNITHKQDMVVKNRIHPEKRAGIEKNVPLHLHVFFDNRRVCTFYTGFRCNIDCWDADKQGMSKNQVNKSGQTSSYVNLHLKAIRAAVDTWAKENPNGTKDDLLKTLRKAADKKEKVVPVETESIYMLFDNFLKERKLSENRYEHYMVLKRCLERYEVHSNNPFTFELDLPSFENYLSIEHTLRKKQHQRGINTVTGLMSKLRSFFLWAVANEHTTINPFHKFKIEEAMYGTPYFITIDERNYLYKHDFKARTELSIQRDIFIFQCHVGCRIGDLMTFTSSNVIDGYLEFIADKTAKKNLRTIRIPLSNTAKEIINKYAGGVMLLPFISEVNYNLAIKEMFLIAKLTRSITVLNTITRKDEQKPLNEIASSGLARRCLIGNLYSKVQDPNIVGSISGHVEGSKAFNRYRTIDDKIKTDTINLIQ